MLPLSSPERLKRHYQGKETEMACKYAKRTDEYHGWEYTITEGVCMFLLPDQDTCAEQYGEVEHTERWKKEHEIDAESLL